jgi:hypothetical protein
MFLMMFSSPGGKVPTVVMLYFLLLVAEGVYNLTYFMLLETAGALVAGVLQVSVARVFLSLFSLSLSLSLSFSLSLSLTHTHTLSLSLRSFC